jgi:hypothetical protein
MFCTTAKSAPLDPAAIRPADQPLTFRAGGAGPALVPFNRISDRRYLVCWKVT